MKFKDWLLSEQPHTSFQFVPDELSFLKGHMVDFGFEDWPLNVRKPIFLAFMNQGAIVPGTKWKITNGQILPTDGTEEATLPSDWKQSVLVLNNDFQPSWVGKRVRPDRLAGFDISNYKDMGDGYAL